MPSIGEITGTLSLRDNFTRPLQGFLGGIKAAHPAAAALAVGVGTAAAAIGAAAAACAAASKQAASFADEMANMSIKTGISAKNLQIFKLAGEHVGTGLGSVAASVNILQRNIENGSKGASEALKRMNMSVSEIKALKPEDQFKAILDGLAKLPSHGEKAATAMALFGRSGTEMLKLADQLGETTKRAEELGQILTDTAIAAGNTMDARYTELNQTMNAVWLQFGAGINQSKGLQTAIKFVTDMIGKMAVWVRDNGDALAGFIDKVVKLAGFLGTFLAPSIGVILKLLGMWVQAWGYVNVGIAKVIDGLAWVFGAIGRVVPGFSALSEIGKTMAFGFRSYGEVTVGVGKGLEAAGDAAISATGDFADLAMGTFDAAGGMNDLAAATDGFNRSATSLNIPKITGGMLDFADKAAKVAAAKILAQQKALDAALAPPVTSMESLFPSDPWNMPGTPQYIAQAGAGPPKPPEAVGEAVDSIARMSAVMEDLAHAFEVFGISADSALARIVTGAARFFAIMPQITGTTTKDAQGNVIQSTSGWGSSILGGKGSPTEKAMGAGQAGIQGAMAVWSATGTGSRAARVGGGALQGASAGAQIAGPIGAIVGGIAGAITGALRGRQLLGIMGDIGRDWGVKISEELGKAIEKTMKAEKVGRFEASLLHFSDILKEAGGLSADNMSKFIEQYNHLLNVTKLGQVDMAKGVAAIGKGFAEMLPALQDMGTKGSVEIGKIVMRVRELGLEVPEITEFLKQTAGDLASTLQPFVEWVGSLEDLSAEEAQAFGSAVATSFYAAAAAAGSFIVAAKQMGEGFAETLQTLIDAGAGEFAAQIQGMYNIITENQAAFDALASLTSGLDMMIQMGLPIGAMGEAIRLTFERIVEKSGDLEGSIRAAWPELVKTFQTYQEMGTEVPGWLQDIIDKGKEMGLSTEIPIEPMQMIVDVLVAIGEALGATIPDSVKTSQQAFSDLGASAGETAGAGADAFDDMGGRMGDTFDKANRDGQEKFDELAGKLKEDLEGMKLPIEDLGKGMENAADAAAKAWDGAAGQIGADLADLAKGVTVPVNYDYSGAGGGGPGGGGPDYAAQHGLSGLFTGPATIAVAEHGPEWVSVTPSGHSPPGADLGPLLAELRFLRAEVARQNEAIRIGIRDTLIQSGAGG